MDSQQHLFLPSEIARLVLGYLHDVNCKITYKTFLKESKDLSEYSALLKRGITYPTTIMGYTLVNLVNEYAAYKLQESKETSSSSGVLWKQFEGVVKQLKKSSQSKLKQKETQTVRHRKLNKKDKIQKLWASDTKETSDEGWVSDNSPFDAVTEETMNSDDSDIDEIPKPPFSKASTSKSSSCLTISDLSSPPNGKVCCRRSKNSANKSRSRELSRNQSMEIDHSDSAVDKTSEKLCKRTLRSSTIKEKRNSSASEKESKDISCAESSANSSILVINEETPSERLDSSQIQNSDNTSEFVTHSVTEIAELDTIYEASNPCSNEVNVNNNNTFCDVSMRCNGNHEVEKDDNNVNQTIVSNETFIVHSSEIHPEASQSNIVNVVQSFPVPVTPQKSAFRPINVDENSNLKTPVKPLTHVHFDHHYKSPRRKRPPRRRADNNITVMGGFSPDNSTCTQFSTNPPGPEMEENTMTEYASMLEKFLEDTNLHEKLAENINKKLVPKKDNVLIKNCVPVKNSAAVHSESGMTTDNMPSTSTGTVNVNTTEQHDVINRYINEQHDIPTGTDNLINDNLTSMLGGVVIKGIADMTGNDPSFESLFSLFMNVKDSSVHDEVDQMITQSNQDDMQNQPDELHTPTDIKENFLVNPENQHQLEQHPVNSQNLNQNSNNSQNQNNCKNTTSTVNNSNDLQVQPASENYQKQLSSDSTKCSVTNSTSNCSSAQTIVCNTGNSSQPANRLSYPVPVHVNSNSNSQSASNQECSMYNIANIHSPAISVISINSPDANSLSTPERVTKTRRPKRITPIPLNGTEILPLHGKIASPQKPLIIIPENKQLNGGMRPGKHFPTPNSNSRNSHFSDGHSDNSQHSTVELTTPLQSTMISTGYPPLNQSQLNETSVSDITVSPGGNHMLAHNKRSMAKAIEENSAFVLSPITPINENTKLASSTPYPISIPACSLSESSGKSPKKEFKKPNLLSKTVSRASPKTETASSKPDDDDSVLCYSLSPLKTDANVIHGTVDDVPFTAVPMGQLSRRFCHVRNLDFGRAQPSSNNIKDSKRRRSSNKSGKSESKSKKVLLPKKISTPEKVEKLKVRPLLPRHTTTKPINNLNQPAEPIATIVNTETAETTKSQVILDMSPKVILNKLEHKQNTKEKRKSADKVKTPKSPKVTTESKSKKEKTKSKRKSDPTTKTASPVKNNKGRSSSRKKNESPKKMHPPLATTMVKEKNLRVNAPVDAIDILDADTREFNQRLEDVNIVNYEIPLDLSAGSTNSQINIVSVTEVSNQFGTFEQNETKAAAEVLASLSMSNSFASISNDPFKPNSLSSEQECKDQLVWRQPSPIPVQNNTAIQGNQHGVSLGASMPTSNIQAEPTDLSIPKETKSAARPVTQSSVIASANLSSGKRKADDSITDSSSSPNLCSEPKKKKMKKKKSIDLRSVNIDALLSKVKYSK